MLALVFVLSLAACTQEINITLTCDEKLAEALANGGSSSNVTPAPTQAPTQAPTEAPKDEPTEAPKDEPTEAPKEDPTDAPSGGELSASSSKEDVVAKYCEVYNNTKATGNFVGHDAMKCTKCEVEGKENGMVKSLVDGLMSTDASATYQLCPYTDGNDGAKCATTAADIKDYKFTDNGDGTATIRLDVNPVENSRRFQDAAGNMFNVMEDVASAIESAPISWSEGDASSNVVLTSSGYCEITYDKATNMMTKANYVLITDADIQHANVLILKDKSAAASFEYTMSYPA